MSFSADVKIELSKMNNLKNKKEVYAELLGYLSTTNITYEKNNIKFVTENEYNINRFAKLLNNMNINDYKIDIQGKVYSILFKRELIEITDEFNDDNIKKAFIRGSFLGSGYINNPKSKYHLEVLFSLKKYSDITIKILSYFGIKSKVINGKNQNFSLYIKDGEEISKFLALIGANLSVLNFEEARVLHDMKNNVNRLVNCETANLNKTIDAAVEQVSIIKKLKETNKFNHLPDTLKEIAILREENPDATLEELGKMLKKPIGKSSVNYRFKKLKENL